MRGGEYATAISVLESGGGEGSEQLLHDATDDGDELLRLGMLLRQCGVGEGTETYVLLILSNPCVRLSEIFLR